MSFLLKHKAVDLTKSRLVGQGTERGCEHHPKNQHFHVF
ncbi:MAG: hypothetical protein PWP06_709 [Candidatus Marinimicrobia bacterium]|jgi:hypothetical protein|nr:hypothetical protein [Candidatus Neomarinimicrobiota bacterium]